MKMTSEIEEVVKTLTFLNKRVSIIIKLISECVIAMSSSPEEAAKELEEIGGIKQKNVKRVNLINRANKEFNERGVVNVVLLNEAISLSEEIILSVELELNNMKG